MKIRVEKIIERGEEGKKVEKWSEWGIIIKLMKE